MKLIANVCMYNEVEKGNLERCLVNLSQYCDEIVIYDDASTDNSVEVANKFTKHILRGVKNDQMSELDHKQQMLDYSIRLGATHIFWLDCDEIVERIGTEGGLRALCENMPADAYSFKEHNLWRSQRWIRTDTLFAVGRFVRLWKVVPGIRFDVIEGVHKRLYPITIKKVVEAPFGVIHYGFWDYPKMMVKIGAHMFTREELIQCTLKNWILDDRICSCFRASDLLFPVENVPIEEWDQPKPKTLEEMRTYKELIEEMI